MNSEAATSCFLVTAIHVLTGLADGIDHLIQRNHELAIPGEGEIRGGDGFYGTHAIALNTGHLHQATNRVAGQSKAMLHRNLGSILDLTWASSHGGGEPGSGHRCRGTHFALATYLGARDGCIHLK